MKKFFLLLFLFISFLVSADTLDSYVVMDINSKRVFKELNKDKTLYPSSITKIMKALVL